MSYSTNQRYGYRYASPPPPSYSSSRSPSPQSSNSSQSRSRRAAGGIFERYGFRESFERHSAHSTFSSSSSSDEGRGRSDDGWHQHSPPSSSHSSAWSSSHCDSRSYEHQTSCFDDSTDSDSERETPRPQHSYARGDDPFPRHSRYDADPGRCDSPHPDTDAGMRSAWYDDDASPPPSTSPGHSSFQSHRFPPRPDADAGMRSTWYDDEDDSMSICEDDEDVYMSDDTLPRSQGRSEDGRRGSGRYARSASRPYSQNDADYERDERPYSHSYTTYDEQEKEECPCPHCNTSYERDGGRQYSRHDSGYASEYDKRPSSPESMVSDHGSESDFESESEPEAWPGSSESSHSGAESESSQSSQQESQSSEEAPTPPFHYYTIIGVDSNATGAEIKKAARNARVTAHPDKLRKPGMSEVELKAIDEKAMLVGMAADVLMDAEKRAEYDREQARMGCGHDDEMN